MHLHVHLVQGLLHPLHRARRFARHVRPLAFESAQGADRLARPKRTAQQAATVQHLQPLAIDHVGLSPRHMAQLPRIDQDRLDAPFFQQLIERNPVHTGRFHRH